jgi:hypothetical protein
MAKSKLESEFLELEFSEICSKLNLSSKLRPPFGISINSRGVAISSDPSYLVKCSSLEIALPSASLI